VNNRTTRGGPHIVQRLREELAREIAEVPGLTLEQRATGYVIDSSINQLGHRVSREGVEVTCEVSFIIGKLPSHAIVGMTSGGATVQVPRMTYHPAKEELYLGEALENAVRGAHPSLIELLGRVQVQEKR
jgi:hypothetical protein